MASSAMNLHQYDFGDWVLLVNGDPGGVLDWPNLNLELLIVRPGQRQATAPDAQNIQIDRLNARIYWRPGPDDLLKPGDMHWQCRDLRPAAQRVFAEGTLRVDKALRPPPLTPTP